jgi:hypothetical protein
MTQIERVQKFVKEFAKKGEASLDDLLSQLRNDLRKELRLPEVEGKSGGSESKIKIQ